MDANEYMKLLDKLEEEVNTDTYHFHDDAQSRIQVKINELREIIDEYVNSETAQQDIW